LRADGRRARLLRNAIFLSCLRCLLVADPAGDDAGQDLAGEPGAEQLAEVGGDLSPGCALQAKMIPVCLSTQISSPTRAACWTRVTGTSCTGRPAVTPITCQRNRARRSEIEMHGGKAGGHSTRRSSGLSCSTSATAAAACRTRATSLLTWARTRPGTCCGTWNSCAGTLAWTSGCFAPFRVVAGFPPSGSGRSRRRRAAASPGRRVGRGRYGWLPGHRGTCSSTTTPLSTGPLTDPLL
jgi:hypothetical protein